MPIIQDELSVAAQGGTELMKNKIDIFLKQEIPDIWSKVDMYVSRVRNFNPLKPSIYYVHDLPNDSEVDHLFKDGGKRFKAIVFVSNWQHQQFNAKFNIDPTVRQVIIPNGIEPIQPNSKWSLLSDKSQPINIIYHTTPHRGLEILKWWIENRMPLFDKKITNRMHFDIFSSFNAYGWGERDKPYQPIFDYLSQHQSVEYHGFQSNETVREYLKNAHVFAYPCIWPETFCIAAVEAMSSKTPIVTSNLAALPETTGGWEVMYPFSSDINTNCALFAYQFEALLKIIEANPERFETECNLQKTRVDSIYNWNLIKYNWVALIKNIYEDTINTHQQQ